MNSTLLKCCLFLVALSIISSRPRRLEESYVDRFRDIAINEMQRTGIPASIKLAQGLMESQSGRSELAVNANNHFGIKCKSNWNGSTYSYKDDDFNDKGELIESCFRKYESAEQSYRDHSEFLKNRSRYKLLFEFDKTDYRSWARGLKLCGYATDPSYADKLIEVIERYELYNLDRDSVAATPAWPAQNLIAETQIIPVQPVLLPMNQPNQQFIKAAITGSTVKPLKKKKRRFHSYLHRVAQADAPIR